MSKKILFLCSIAVFLCFALVMQAQENQNFLQQLLGVRSPATDDGYGYGYDDQEYPDAPENFSALDRKATNAILGWDAPSQEVTYYTLRYGKTPRTRQSKSVLGSRTTAKLKFLTSNTRYYAKIKATNDSGSSAFSEKINFRTLPAKVKNVRVPASTITNSSFKVMWKKTNGNNIFYRLRIINTKGKTVKKITTKKIQKNISGLKSDSLYRIKVRALYRNRLIQAGAWSDLARAWTLE